MGRSERQLPRTLRRVLLALLVATFAAGWYMGPLPAQPGFLLFFLPCVLGASMYGRMFALPAAAAVAAIVWQHELVAAAMCVAVLLIGERTQHLRRRLGRFAHRSFTDRLTGLYNYDFLQAQVRFEVDRVKRYGGSCSVIVLDLDHFKRFNDTYGHQAGNLLLRAVADTVQEVKRDTDIAARFGGEEFVVLVPGEADEAVRLAERLRRSVAEMHVPQLEPGAAVTTSAGIASFPQQASNAAELFERADQALYNAKGSGRNRVVVYPNVQVRTREQVGKAS